MKRLILFVSLALATIASAQQLRPLEPVKAFQYQMNGTWLPNVSQLHVGAENYAEVINLRPTSTGYETVEGATTLNTTATEVPINLHQFNKPGESHLVAKIFDTPNYYLYDNTTAIPGAGNFSASALYTVSDEHGYFANGPQGTMFYADDDYNLVWGGDEMRPFKVLTSGDADAVGARDFTQNASTAITTDNFALDVAASYNYLFIGTPIMLDGVKIYVQAANAAASTITGTVWNGSAWGALAVTDGTAAGGISLAQTGEITWTFAPATPKVRYLQGTALYWYRFQLSAGSATIYQVSVSAPMQTVKDVWNGAKRKCIAFQASRSSVYEDYTFHVEAQDSAAGAVYAASIGGLVAADSIIVMFDDRAMGIDINMYAGLVNAAAAKIDAVEYWNGAAWTAVAYFNDGTLTGTASFSQSGVLWWTAPDADSEHPHELFGKKGYAYRLGLDGTLTTGTDYTGTSVDFAGGITAPLDISGYHMVGQYNGRVLLIDGSKVDYSQSNTPWVFNGIDSSDSGKYSLYFGDDNQIVATTSLFNRYGSSLIETQLFLKKNSSYMLTGVQPHIQYAEPFVTRVISETIGCAAPMTLRSYVSDMSEGLTMGVAVWLDYAGPVAFFGTAPTRIPGVENYFDPAEDECVNYDYIHKATAYIDTVHDQYNLLIPSGSAATNNNLWLVYDFKTKKWFEKDPGILSPVDWDGTGDAVTWDVSGDVVYWVTDAYTENYPQVVCPVFDASGAKYNYGITSEGNLNRLDYGQTWGEVPIYQRIKTGVFSPSMTDPLGFWTYSLLRGIRIISEATTEDTDLHVSFYKDGQVSTQFFNVPLDSGGVISKSSNPSNNVSEKADAFQVAFTAVTGTDKWTPLAWGYKSLLIREE